MGKGFVIGVVWGLVVAIVVLAGMSLNTPLPERPSQRAEAADAVPAALPAPDTAPEPPEDALPQPAPEEASPAAAGQPAPAGNAPADTILLPAGSEFNRPLPEEDAALPSADTAPIGTLPTAPAVLDESLAPAYDPAPAPQPGIAEIPLPPQGNDLSDTAIALSPGAVAQVPGIGSAPTRLSLPQVERGPRPDQQTADAPQAPMAPVPETDAAAPDVARAPDAESAAVDAEIAPVAPNSRLSLVGEGSTLVFDTPRLPTIGTDDTAVSPAVEDAVEDIGPQPAILANAAMFDTSESRPLLAIILIDAPDSPLERTVLTQFGFPVAFAIDPLLPDAAARATAFRDAGFEVVMLASAIPDGATPADAEVALAGGFAVIPQAVAVLDTADNRVQSDSAVLQTVVDVLAETGHGFVAYPRGLNVAEQSAARQDVPAATVFRVLDADQDRATVITRYLARAAFAAGQEGAVIVVGHTYADTVTALYSWALADRSEAVAIAPLSAVLTRPRS